MVQSDLKAYAQTMADAKTTATKAGGSGIRKALQQLEIAGLIQITKPAGRVMTPKGRKLMQEVAGDLAKELVKTVPELKKYQGE